MSFCQEFVPVLFQEQYNLLYTLRDISNAHQVQSSLVQFIRLILYMPSTSTNTYSYSFIFISMIATYPCSDVKTKPLPCILDSAFHDDMVLPSCPCRSRPLIDVLVCNV